MKSPFSDDPVVAKGSISDLKAVIKSINSLSESNRNMLKSVLYDTTKLVFYRQSRLGKPDLTKIEISKLVHLAHFLNVTHSCYDVKDSLADCMYDISEEAAKRYFQEKVEGNVTDYFGREIIIPKKGIRTIYKDYKDGGKHNQVPHAYESFRGQTLPWIRWSLQNSKKVLYRNEANVISFFYCMDFKFRNSSENAIFTVFARKETKSILQPIEFVTAFRFNDYNRFLKTVEKFTPIKLKGPPVS